METKLYKDQLVGKLMALFMDADPANIDNAVTQAKSLLTAEHQLTAKQRQVKRRIDFEKLFGSQLATLKDRGCPEQIVEALQSQKNAVVQKASDIAIGEGNIPFLPVIKPTYLGYYGLMAMVWNGSKKGYTYLKPDAITDQFETPDGLYYVYGVEDGNATRGKRSLDTEEIFKEQSRSPLTVAEVVALTTHTDVLSRHYVQAAGSRCEPSGRIMPCVFLGYGRSILDWFFLDALNDRSGFASCLCRQ